MVRKLLSSTIGRAKVAIVFLFFAFFGIWTPTTRGQYPNYLYDYNYDPPPPYEYGGSYDGSYGPGGPPPIGPPPPDGSPPDGSPPPPDGSPPDGSPPPPDSPPPDGSPSPDASPPPGGEPIDYPYYSYDPGYLTDPPLYGGYGSSNTSTTYCQGSPTFCVTQTSSFYGAVGSVEIEPVDGGGINEDAIWGCPDVIVRLICPSTQFFTVSTLALVSYPSSVVMKCVINEWQLVDPPGAIFTPGLLAGCSTGHICEGVFVPPSDVVISGASVKVFSVTPPALLTQGVLLEETSYVIMASAGELMEVVCADPKNGMWQGGYHSSFLVVCGDPLWSSNSLPECYSVCKTAAGGLCRLPFFSAGEEHASCHDGYCGFVYNEIDSVINMVPCDMTSNCDDEDLLLCGGGPESQCQVSLNLDDLATLGVTNLQPRRTWATPTSAEIQGCPGEMEVVECPNTLSVVMVGLITGPLVLGSEATLGCDPFGFTILELSVNVTYQEIFSVTCKDITTTSSTSSTILTSSSTTGPSGATSLTSTTLGITLAGVSSGATTSPASGASESVNMTTGLTVSASTATTPGTNTGGTTGATTGTASATTIAGGSGSSAGASSGLSSTTPPAYTTTTRGEYILRVS